MHQYPQYAVARRRTRTVTGALLIAALLGGCASPTKVSSVWHDDNQRAVRYDRLLVVAVSDNADRRLSFEDALVNQLRGPNTQAWASARLMPADAPINEESLRAIVAKQQANAVIVTKLESVEVKPVESGGRSDVLARKNETGIGMTPERKSGTVFQYNYEEKIEPVFITAEYSAVLTTDVYNVTDGTNIYSVITTTSGQNTVAEVIAELSKAIAQRLRSDGAIR